MTDKIRVLYVDDEQDFLGISKLFLEESGDFSVVTIDSVADALALLNSEKFDVIISDYQMPGLDGIKFLKEVRASGNTIPFILFTGLGREEIVIQALNEGADFYLKKGSDHEPQFTELMHKVRLAVQKRRSEDELREESKRTEEELRITGERLLMAQEIGHTGSWELDLATGNVWGSIEAFRIFGFNRPANGIMPIEFVEERIPERELVHQALISLIENGEDYSLEYTIEPADNSGPRFIRSTAKIIHDDQKKPISVVGVIHDITSHKKAEEDANKAANNITTLINSIDEMVFVFDTNGYIIKTNETVNKRLQYTDEELIGMHVLQINVPERREETYSILAGILDGTASICPIPVMAKDGTQIEVETKVVKGSWDNMNVLIGVSRDVTERRKAEKALLESEGRFRTLSNAAFEGIMIHDKGTIVDCNPQFAELFGYRPDEIIGLNWFKFLMTPESRGALLKWREKGSKGTIDIIGIKKDGTEFYGETSSTTIIWQGKSNSIVHMHDITERKKVLEKLRESEENLRLKLDSVLSPDIDIIEQDLAQILDTGSIQSMFNDFHSVTGMPIGIVDLNGNILVKVGWQDICTKFHRVHPETLKNCFESNLVLSRGVSKGEFRAYRCRNNMWDIVTPIYISDKHVGNLFFGQFFYEDEIPDQQLFIKMAEKFGFNKDEYLAALNRVPRWSREKVQNTMKFYAKFAELISKLSYSNLKLAKMIINQKTD